MTDATTINDAAVLAYECRTTMTTLDGRPYTPVVGQRNPAVHVRNERVVVLVEHGPMTSEDWSQRKAKEDRMLARSGRTDQRYLDFVLERMDPSLRAMLTKEGADDVQATDALLRACMRREPRRWDDLDAVEAEVRRRMVGYIDDLAVAFQVAHSRAVGYPSFLHLEHFCLARSAEECIRHHGYMMRCAGPITLEVHEQEQRRLAEWPARSAEFSRMFAESCKSAAARVAAAKFAARINRDRTSREA